MLPASTFPTCRHDNTTFQLLGATVADQLHRQHFTDIHLGKLALSELVRQQQIASAGAAQGDPIEALGQTLRGPCSKCCRFIAKCKSHDLPNADSPQNFAGCTQASCSSAWMPKVQRYAGMHALSCTHVCRHVREHMCICIFMYPSCRGHASTAITHLNRAQTKPKSQGP